MLVVISLISLLIAILLPVTSSARSEARQVECRNNLRSLATASHTSAVDNDGLFIQNAGGGSPQLVEAPGFDSSRRNWSGYLENYAPETGSPSMYCPFFLEDEIHSFPSGWGGSSFGPDYYWMGYANFATPTNATGDPNWRPLIDGPRFVDSTPSDMPLFSDIIEGNLNGNLPDWIHYSHSEGRSLNGGGETSSNSKQLGPSGFNSALVDGSVNWTAFSPNAEGLEISFSTQESDQIGFIWNFDSRE